MFENIKEFRQKTGDKYKDISDQRLINFLYEEEVVKDPNVEMDFLEYNKKMNPEKNSFGSITKFKETFQSAYPELEQMSPYDVGIFAHQYAKKKGTLVDFKDFYNDFNPQKKNVRIGFTEVPIETLDFRPVTGNPARTKEDIEKELDYGQEDVPVLNTMRAKASFTEDEADLKNLYERELSAFYDKPVKVFTGKLSEDYEFINPDTGKTQFVNKPGLDVGDVLSLSGDAIYLAGDTIGRIAGSSLGPLGTIAGSGIGSAYGDALRLAIGHRYFGAGDQTQNEENLAKSFIQYVRKNGRFDEINALAEAVGMTIPGFYKLGTKLAKLKKLDASEFGDTVKDSKESLEVLDNFNDKLASQNQNTKLKFTLGQAANDAELLAKQSQFEKNSNYGEKGRFEQFGKEQANALNVYFKTLKSPFNTRQINAPDELAEENLEMYIRNNIIKERQEPIRKAMIRRMENSEKNLKDEVVVLPDGQYKEQGENIRTIFDEIDADAFKNFSNRYRALDELGKSRKINTDVISNLYNKLNERDKLSLLKKKIGIKELFQKPKKDISLSELKETRTDLLALERQMGRTGEVGPKGFPRNLLDAIDKQINKDLKVDDPWLVEYNAISKDYNNYKQKFGGIVNKLLSRKNGRLVIGDEDVFLQTFKPDNNMGQGRRMDEIIDVLSEDPSKREVYSNSILSFYKDKVMDVGGNFNREAHKKFIKDYKGSLEKFFSPQEMQKIKNVDGLSDVVENIRFKNERLEKSLKQSSFGQIDSIDPEEMFSKSFIVDKPVTLSRMMKVLRKDDTALKGYQNEVHNYMYKEITDNRGNFDFNKFSGFMKRNEKKMNKVFQDQPEYLKDLKLFGEALERVSRKATGTPLTEGPQSLIDILRGAIFTPLTREGRAFTGGIKLYRKTIDKQLANIMLDPSNLKELVQLQKGKVLKEKKLRKFAEIFKLPTKAFTDPNLIDQFGDVGVEEMFEAETPPPSNTLEEKDIEQDKDDEVIIAPSPMSKAPSPTVDMFAMEQAPRPTKPAPIAPPPVQQPQPAGIASLPQDRGQTYAGLFPNDPSGQMIAQRGTQDA